jgi:pimeloyl-ACP methyl ester carboxylesterase
MLSSLALVVAAAAADPASTTLLAPATIGAPVATSTAIDSSNSVSLETKDRQLLSASFYEPKRRKSSPPAPAAMLIHDAGSSRDELAEMAAYLHKKGFAVLTVDLRGHGASATDDTNFEKADEKTRETLWAMSTRDIDAATKFLLKQDGVHATNLSIVGVGAGAALAVRRAAKDENVRAVVLIDPAKESFGFDVSGGVGDLGGLPTLILAPKSSREAADEIQASAHEANDGLEYVEINALKNDSAEILGDKRLKSSASSWLRDRVMPKK